MVGTVQVQLAWGGAIVLAGNCLGGIVLGENCSGGNCLRGICPGEIVLFPSRPSAVVWLPLLRAILGNMYIVIVC